MLEKHFGADENIFRFLSFSTQAIFKDSLFCFFLFFDSTVD